VPSVISLNSLSAGIATTEFQAWATGALSPGSRDRSRFYFANEASCASAATCAELGAVSATRTPTSRSWRAATTPVCP